jgi:hypothetical protein
VGFESEPVDEWTRSAVLVESVRTAAGPRQKVLGYLGSIEEQYLGQVGHRVGFWASAEARLDELGPTAEERARIVAALEAVVPRPTDEERAAQEERWAAREAEQAEAAARINESHSKRRERPMSPDRLLRGLRAERYLEAVAAEHPDSREAEFIRRLREREERAAAEADEVAGTLRQPPARRKGTTTGRRRARSKK